MFTINKKEKGLSAWGLTLLALGTVVGGSFFLGSAVPIRNSGPSVLIAYLLGGALVYVILTSLSEMTTADTSPGSFRTFAQREFGNAAGFVVGWVYWTGMILAMSSEAVAVSILIKNWIPEVKITTIGIIIIVSVTTINLLGTDKMSRLENLLASIKLLAIIGFVATGVALVFGLFPNKPFIGLGQIENEIFFTGGIKGIAGSMLIVIFTYAGFEIIGLAASETSEPHKVVPKAIKYTVFSLIGLYFLSILVLLPLIATSQLNEETSPFVAALANNGIYWAANLMNSILIIAIISTMLAATFSLARMLRSLAVESFAPKILNEKSDIPTKCIVFSGLAILLAFSSSFFLPEKVYVFLVSSGGFSLLFTYLIILLTHYKFRKTNGCPPMGHCQLKGYPILSIISIISILLIIISMPFIPGQGSGLAAGLILVIFFTACYYIYNRIKKFK